MEFTIGSVMSLKVVSGNSLLERLVASVGLVIGRDFEMLDTS